MAIDEVLFSISVSILSRLSWLRLFGYFTIILSPSKVSLTTISFSYERYFIAYLACLGAIAKTRRTRMSLFCAINSYLPAVSIKLVSFRSPYLLKDLRLFTSCGLEWTIRRRERKNLTYPPLRLLSCWSSYSHWVICILSLSLRVFKSLFNSFKQVRSCALEGSLSVKSNFWSCISILKWQSKTVLIIVSFLVIASLRYYFLSNSTVIIIIIEAIYF